MAGDRAVALVAGHLRARVVARALPQVVDVDALDDVLVDADLGDLDPADAVALGGAAKGASVVGVGSSDAGVVVAGRRRRGRAPRPLRLLELVLQVVLGLGRVDPGAPELVGDEQQEQEPDGDEGAPDGSEHLAHGRGG